MDDGSKECPACFRKLPFSDFYKDSHRPDGLRNRCKECWNSKRLVPVKREDDFDAEGLKPCRICGLKLPITGFYRRGSGVRNDCKECVKERTRLRELAKPELVRATREAWVQRSAGHLAAYKRAWYQANREAALAKQTLWVQNNRERRRKTWLAWYQANPEARGRGERKRRALKRGADTRTITNKEWYRLVDRYHGLCAYCGLRPWKHRDHVIPLKQGGRHAIGNLLPACASCNHSKKDKTITQWRQMQRRRSPAPVG